MGTLSSVNDGPVTPEVTSSLSTPDRKRSLSVPPMLLALADEVIEGAAGLGLVSRAPSVRRCATVREMNPGAAMIAKRAVTILYF